MLESAGRQSLLRGQTVVMEVLHEWWEQPAINAVDWIKRESSKLLRKAYIQLEHALLVSQRHIAPEDRKPCVCVLCS